MSSILSHFSPRNGAARSPPRIPVDSVKGFDRQSGRSSAIATHVTISAAIALKFNPQWYYRSAIEARSKVNGAIVPTPSRLPLPLPYRFP
ncbi:hypothetical protein JJD41_02610 [Oxynema sp. CENA135]|uniref:hypothetical protein n=1 Tax=Oxynema sp. CENA135 TaxID=984206 RepID=UPI00190A0036|nr:hypothetical protein [Oxynema sp. CENA135]MBK4728782.1 hypothetical protein [Oxynema sp. CENA135]